jgi:cysteinyl-tRNA synthetase
VSQIRLHDTRTGLVRALEPRASGRVGIYACGPTVYARIHVGNARPFVTFSLLRRLLHHEGFATRLVFNITDVNDKIYAAAAAAGLDSVELSREMTAHYRADTDALGLGRPDAEPLASEWIAQIVALIEELIERGNAYVADGDVYFAVRSDPHYGELSHRRLADMDQGEEVEGAERKRDPLDFALWKARKPHEDAAWPSPWGEGRPGWHIECSVMAEGELGPEFEIHGGGSDLLFPHHENEQAQTRAARGRPLAQLWVHNGMVRVRSEKMAKSAGNFFLLHRALERYGREPLLMFFAGAHYRQPMDFDEERLAEAERLVARLREAARRLTPEGPSPEFSAPLRERFLAALREDFNMPAAMPALWEWVHAANSARAPVGDGDLREMLWLLGLESLLDRAEVEVPAAVRELAGEREAARRARDFAAADRLRERLRELGWEVRDSPEGPELRPL